MYRYLTFTRMNLVLLEETYIPSAFLGSHVGSQAQGALRATGGETLAGSALPLHQVCTHRQSG